MNDEYLGIPNTSRVNHGLVTAVPCEDITFGIFKRRMRKPTIKTFQKIY